MRPAHVGLEVPEESFNGVGVYITFDVDALRVLDPAELVDARTVEDVVAAPIVGEDHRTRQDELMQSRADRVCCLFLRTVVSDEGSAHSSIALAGRAAHVC